MLTLIQTEQVMGSVDKNFERGPLERTLNTFYTFSGLLHGLQELKKYENAYKARYFKDGVGTWVEFNFLGTQTLPYDKYDRPEIAKAIIEAMEALGCEPLPRLPDEKEEQSPQPPTPDEPPEDDQ